MMSNDPVQSELLRMRQDFGRELENLKSDVYGDLSREKSGLISRVSRVETIVISQTTTLRWVIYILIGVLIVSIANFILIAVLFSRV